ncbi:MAG TPA: N-acetyl-D-Glu racemase DgcA [Hyphomicrobiales bacterium]|nr:N-acetyl-D-Glu racemase DgcA [Hyphomicrobiales bacterium]
MTRRLTVLTERWPIAGRFTIARGSKTAAEVVVAEIAEDGVVGRGECVPYARYGETVEGVAAAVAGQANAVAAGLDRAGLAERLPGGAARNALDCALWDFEAKRAGRRAWDLAGLMEPRPVTTAYTISLGEPSAMAAAAAKAAGRPLLKVKLGAPGDPARIRAVRAAVPGARLVVDVNEGWTAATLAENLAACADAGVEMVEQPLAADSDGVLAEIRCPLPVFADESVHGLATVAALAGRYDGINVKLDKTGGLTEALMVAAEADRLGLGVIVGCMVATSLAMAPATLLTPGARYVDLDGPLLLARDRPHGLVYEGSTLQPPAAALWG